MSLRMSKCWYSNNCLHFLNCVVPLEPLDVSYGKVNKRKMRKINESKTAIVQKYLVIELQNDLVIVIHEKLSEFV